MWTSSSGVTQSLKLSLYSSKKKKKLFSLRKFTCQKHWALAMAHKCKVTNYFRGPSPMMFNELDRMNWANGPTRIASFTTSIKKLMLVAERLCYSTIPPIFKPLSLLRT
jgi:hypothetical protein